MSRDLRDLGLRAGAALVATLLIAPVAALFLTTTPFHRVLTRTFLGAILVAFLVRRGSWKTWPANFAAMGFRGPERRKRFLLGAGMGVGLFALLLGASILLGGREPLAGPYRIPFVRHLLGALVSGVVVGFLEEILCRGYLKNVLGGWWSAAIYAAVHFVRPLVTSEPAVGGYDPLLAVRRMPEMFGGWSDPRAATLGFLSLFLFGLALNRLRERTGTLYAGIGLHAGLVSAIAFYRRFYSSVAVGAGAWVHGGPRLHDGLLGTLLMALVLLACHRGRFRQV